MIERKTSMARPRAIYASVPPNEAGIPKWDEVFGTIPVTYSMPCSSWPNLDWDGNVLDESLPTEYDLEHPQYLWSHPLVRDPINGESYTFIRQWLVGEPGGTFDYQTIPADDLIFVISHAADNQYALALIVGEVTTGTVQAPAGANTVIPSPQEAWRNVKTYLYHVNLAEFSPGTPVNLISEVINASQAPHGIVTSNPAMFTWIMQVFNHT
jgi:hypothetical protein